jgi:hypothetical protein
MAEVLAFLPKDGLRKAAYAPRKREKLEQAECLADVSRETSRDKLTASEIRRPAIKAPA